MNCMAAAGNPAQPAQTCPESAGQHTLVDVRVLDHLIVAGSDVLSGASRRCSLALRVFSETGTA